MKKIIFLIVILSLATSCKSKRESCIEGLVDEQGYSYKEACEACDEMALESSRCY